MFIEHMDQMVYIWQTSHKKQLRKKWITFERDVFSAACIYLDLTIVPPAKDFFFSNKYKQA